MKYKAQVIYKGIAVDVNVKAQEKGTFPIDAVVNMPGDIVINVEGECSPVESFMYFRAINQLVKLGTK